MAASRGDRRMEQTAPSRRTQPPARQPRGLALIPLYVWALGIVVIVLLTMVAGLWALYALRGQWAPSGPTPTPIIWTPTPAPATPTPTFTPEPVEEPTPTAPAGIAIGGYVQVTGTEGLGLSLREGPGKEYQRMDVALEGEIFEVVDGPTQAGDVIWWKLRDPKNPARSWWAAANFLVPVPAP